METIDWFCSGAMRLLVGGAVALGMAWLVAVAVRGCGRYFSDRRGLGRPLPLGKHGPAPAVPITVEKEDWEYPEFWEQVERELCLDFGLWLLLPNGMYETGKHRRAGYVYNANHNHDAERHGQFLLPSETLAVCEHQLNRWREYQATYADCLSPLQVDQAEDQVRRWTDLVEKLRADCRPTAEVSIPTEARTLTPIAPLAGDPPVHLYRRVLTSGPTHEAEVSMVAEVPVTVQAEADVVSQGAE